MSYIFYKSPPRDCFCFVLALYVYTVLSIAKAMLSYTFTAKVSIENAYAVNSISYKNIHPKFDNYKINFCIIVISKNWRDV